LRPSTSPRIGRRSRPQGSRSPRTGEDRGRRITRARAAMDPRIAYSSWHPGHVVPSIGLVNAWPDVRRSHWLLRAGAAGTLPASRRS
jgi:hypothetical protein